MSEMLDSHAVVDQREVGRATAPGRPGAVTVGLWLTCLSAATLPWTGVRLGGVTFAEVFLILAALTLVGADLRRPMPALPGWVWALALAVLATGVVNQFDPATTAFMVDRDQLLGNYTVVHSAPATITNLVVMVPLLVRILLMPFVFGLARLHEPAAPYRIAKAFVVGVVISSAIGAADSRGLTSLGPALTGVPVQGTRAAGLTQHPNALALTCVFALPILVWLVRAAMGRRRSLTVIAVAVVLLGLYASGSRSGAVAAGLTAVGALFLLPEYRRHLATIALGLTTAAGTLFVVRPDVGSALLTGLRLTGGGSAGSDQARTIVNDQGMRDFLHSPIHGIGFAIAEQAHIVYLQALAVGGVILLAGLLIYMTGALARCIRIAKSEPMAVPLFVAVLGGAITNAAQNALTPAVVYFAESLIATLSVSATAVERVSQRESRPVNSDSGSRAR